MMNGAEVGAEMSTRLVNRLAMHLGCTHSYPDWYVVRRLLWLRINARLRGLMRLPMARMLRDPALVTRLTLSRLPEMSLFPSADVKHAAMREFGVSMRDVRDWRYWLVLGAMTFVAACAGIVLGQIVVQSLGVVASGAVNYWIRLVTMATVFWMLLSRTQRFGAAGRLRLKLLDLGVVVCLRCGYSLHGHRGDAQRCPECGRVIDERVAALLALPMNALAGDDELHIHDRAA